MLYISRKKEHGVRGAEKSGNSCHSLESKTREAVAKETGVSPRTIANDAAYAEAGKRNMAVIGGAKNQNAKVAF
jgi:hypothetical protein